LASGDQVAQFTNVAVYSDDQLWGSYQSNGSPATLSRSQTLVREGSSTPSDTDSVSGVVFKSSGTSLTDTFGLDPALTYTLTITED